jgi:putative transposase
MPRSARLDLPGLLQHVMVRGIEKRNIFHEDKDREFFLERLSRLLQETETDCLAWSLMPNHLHLLLRPRRGKLAFLMRRLLTGYALHFNLRYNRTGHLFQNRFKSIVCEEEPYLLESIRYIHLNPLRSGLVQDIGELDHYPWSGHAVLVGKRQWVGQKVDEVLAHFETRKKFARSRYRNFVIEGIPQGRRDELVGGGMRRILKLTGDEEAGGYDERVLGRREFVETLRQNRELSDRLPIVMPIPELVERIANFFGIKPEELKQRNKRKNFADARSLISYFAVREMSHNGVEVAGILKMSRSGVSVAANRGKRLVQANPSLRNLMGN